MKAKTTPAPRRAGTAIKNRATREAALIETLELMRVSAPAKHSRMLRLLVEASSRSRKQE